MDGRRKVLGLLGAVTLVSAGYCAVYPASRKDDRLRIGIPGLQNPDLSGDWIASDRNLFAKAGVQTEYVPGGPNAPPALTLLLAGRVDVAKVNWFSFIDAVSRGADLVIVGASTPQNPNCLISRPKRPVRTPGDLIGKKLLLQYKEYSEIIAAILRYNGLPPDFTVSPTGYSAEAMFAGDGDAYFAFLTGGPVNLAMSGKKPGVDFLVTPLSAMGYRVADGLFVVRRATLATKRMALIQYFRAVMQGLNIAAQSPAYAANLAVDTYAMDAGLNPKSQLRAIETYLPLSVSAQSGRRFEISPQTISTMYTFARLAGRTRLAPSGRLFDLHPLKEALGTV